MVLGRGAWGPGGVPPPGQAPGGGLGLHRGGQEVVVIATVPSARVSRRHGGPQAGIPYPPGYYGPGSEARSPGACLTKGRVADLERFASHI